jgi:dihydroflavonol-4-reductase
LDLQSSTVVVTGASGHVGSNLVPALLKRGAHVRALVLQKDPGMFPPSVEVHRADVRDAASLRRPFHGADVVIHLAARISIDGDGDGQVRAVNVDGTRNVASAALAACVKRFVHVSSVHAFDITPFDGVLNESRHAAGPGRPAYDRSKAAGEAVVREMMARGLDATICNPVGVIGPNDPMPSRMGQFFLDLARGRLPCISTGGFSFVDARDVAQSIIAAVERGRTGENYLLHGHWRSLVELAVIAAPHTGREPPLVIQNGLLAALSPLFTCLAWLTGDEPLVTSEAMLTLASQCRISGAKAAAELGHRPRPLAESVRDVYRDFVRTGHLIETTAGLRRPANGGRIRSWTPT